MTVVPGDPPSISACAVTAREVGARLAGQAEALRAAYEHLGEGWPGPASATARRRGGELAGATGAASSELDRVATVLQDHATDLADLLARARVLEARAAAAGLEVRDGRVVAAWGVRGEAGPGVERDRRDAAIALQHDLDLLLARHRRQRDRLLAVLRESTTTLAAVSHGLRRG